jgi:hypothetical protein
MGGCIPKLLFDRATCLLPGVGVAAESGAGGGGIGEAGAGVDDCGWFDHGVLLSSWFGWIQ